jgi:hypothetical protein
MSDLKITIKDCWFHRNGVGGAGFYAVLFEEAEQGLMVASLFDEPGYCAVYKVSLLSKENVRFGENSWRGDSFEAALRPLVKKWAKKEGTGRLGPFALPREAPDVSK